MNEVVFDQKLMNRFAPKLIRDMCFTPKKIDVRPLTIDQSNLT